VIVESCLVEIVGRLILWPIVWILLFPLFFVVATPFVLSLAVVRGGGWSANVRAGYEGVFRRWMGSRQYVCF
jgi:hypothetical protein